MFQVQDASTVCFRSTEQPITMCFRIFSFQILNVYIPCIRNNQVLSKKSGGETMGSIANIHRPNELKRKMGCSTNSQLLMCLPYMTACMKNDARVYAYKFRFNSNVYKYWVALNITLHPVAEYYL